MPGLSPLPASLGEVSSVMVLPGDARWAEPWERKPWLVAGEEDPLRLARALTAWWSEEGADTLAAVVAVDGSRSPERWTAAPRPGGDALLLLPGDGFAGPRSHWRGALAATWDADRVVEVLPDEPRARLVVLVSAEPPAAFALRLRRLAQDERMRGRLLAGWSLAGPVREDLARSLLDEGLLGGIGLAEHSLVARRTAVETLAGIRRTLTAGAEDLRVEQLPGPFLWHF